MTVGEVRITPGFDLGIDIVFVQGPKEYDYDDYQTAKSLLLTTYRNLINTAYSKGYKNILCPSLGTGSYCFQHEEIAKEVISIIKECIRDKDINIDLVIYDEKDKIYYQ